MIIPNIWKNEKCSKPPTSIIQCIPHECHLESIGAGGSILKPMVSWHGILMYFDPSRTGQWPLGFHDGPKRPNSSSQTGALLEDKYIWRLELPSTSVQPATPFGFLLESPLVNGWVTIVLVESHFRWCCFLLDPMTHPHFSLVHGHIWSYHLSIVDWFCNLFCWLNPELLLQSQCFIQIPYFFWLNL